MNKPLYVLDIFSGIGGFSIGLEKAGMKTVAFCDNEPFCRKVLSHHWHDVPVFEDVHELGAEALSKHNITHIDLIAGGFPCQDISCAGKQIGIEGKRSGLWKEFARLINELRPKYALIENVANLRARGLVTVLQDLWQIGYDAEWHCIPASAIGAPHRRDRIWIVAYPNCKSKHGLPIRTQKKISNIGDRHQDSLISNTDSSRCIGDKSKKARTNDTQGRQKCPKNAITSRDVNAAEGLSLYEGRPGKTENKTAIPEKTAIIANAYRAGLQGHGKAESVSQICTQEQVSLFRSTRGAEQWAVEPNIARLKDERLNPDWVEWLMGFPIQWTQGGSRRQRLIALGNAIVPQMAELLGQAIVLHHKNQTYGYN